MITADALRVSGDASITAETARADAGDITIAAGRLIDLEDSEVTTSAAGGEGSGGNIFINLRSVTDDPGLVVLDGGRIVAEAERGAGGNVRILADSFIRTPDSVISAASRLGLPGRVAIGAPEQDVSSGLVTLPAGFLDASALLPESGAARRSDALSSFTAAGRDGLPPGPDAPLPGFYALGPDGAGAATATATPLRGDRLELAAAPARPAPAVPMGCGG